jgi:hypothetical protein
MATRRKSKRTTGRATARRKTATRRKTSARRKAGTRRKSSARRKTTKRGKVAKTTRRAIHATRRKATTTRRTVAARKTTKRTAAATRRSRPEIRNSKRPTARRAPPARVFEPAAPRCRSRIPVEVECQGRIEHAAIADMSASGARLVGPRLDFPVGTPLAIRYPTSGGVTAPVILAEFVRTTEDGFAVQILPR